MNNFAAITNAIKVLNNSILEAEHNIKQWEMEIEKIQKECCHEDIEEYIAYYDDIKQCTCKICGKIWKESF